MPKRTKKNSIESKEVAWKKLKSIEIKNFKAIKELSIGLSDVTILVGTNGSGKSSALQAMHWATRAASYIANKTDVIVSFDKIDYLPSSNPLGTAHKADLPTLKRADPTLVSFCHCDDENEKISIRAAKNSGGIAVELSNANSSFKQRDIFITAYIPGLAGLSEKETILAQPLFRRQAASGDAGGVLRNALFNLASPQKGEAVLKHPEKEKPDNSAEAIARLKKLNELLGEVHEGIEVDVNFNDKEDVHIQAVFASKGVVRTLGDAATGILQVIQIFAYVILFRPKLMLIDEPDAHLHPDKQEKLIATLEKIAVEFNTQIIITTHSPFIVNAANSNTELVWIDQGKERNNVEQSTIRKMLGWGAMSKPCLFFIEDEDDTAIKAVLKQWPKLNRQIAICRCFGVKNLPIAEFANELLQAGQVALVHRDRDFMTEAECLEWNKKYNDYKNPQTKIRAWITRHSDFEGYFCQVSYLAKLYSVDEEEAKNWIDEAVAILEAEKKAYNKFVEKRKDSNSYFYRDGKGGSPHTDPLWDEAKPADRVLGKMLHKALKTVVKTKLNKDEKRQDDMLLNNFKIPDEYELADDLKKAFQELGLEVD